MLDFGPVWAHREDLLRGVLTTAALSAVGVAGAGAIGLVIGPAGATASRPCRWAAIAYVEGVRNIPLLLHIYAWYFLLAALDLPPFLCAALGLSIYSGAYAAEIVRGGLLAVGAGQREAAVSLGLSGWRAWRLVVWPQALRLIAPSLGALTSQLIKDSSLASVIAVGELAYEAGAVEADTFRTTEVYGVVVVAYLLLVTVAGWGFAVLPGRLRPARGAADA